MGAVVALEQDFLFAAPVAAADVDAGLDAVYAFQGLVHQANRHLQLVGWVAAAWVERAHMKVSVVSSPKTT